MKNNTNIKNDTFIEKVMFIVILLVGFPLLVTLVATILESITIEFIIITGVVLALLAFIIAFILIVTCTD